MASGEVRTIAPMAIKKRSWQEELAIIDRVMLAISDVIDPEEMVGKYWDGIGELVPMHDFLALSRRGVEPPEYLITRSSKFSEEINPWKERDRLPRMSGGLLGEIAYADKPVIIENLEERLKADDPAKFYLEGFHTLAAFPQYERGKGLNVGISLYRPGVEFDSSMMPMLHWQAGLFGRGVLALVLSNQLKAAMADLDRELQVVGEIQRSLLPREMPQIEGFDIAAFYKTSARAGGDYYDFFPVAENEIGIIIADVSGHGTPAAVLMAITHAIAHTRPGKPYPPGELLAYLNHHLVKSYTTSGSFVTAFYAGLDTKTRKMEYASAGHNPPRLLRGKEIRSVDTTGGLPLGIFAGEKFAEASMTLERGDLLLLYTDGITEAMSPAQAGGSRELFGLERLDEVLLGCASLDAKGCIERVCSEVEKFTKNGALMDDQTLIAIRCV